MWLVGRARPSFFSAHPGTQAPGQGPRLFMRHRHVFSCAFPHVPVHWPRPCAAKVTLPDSSKVHPPNVLLPTQSPLPFSPATRIGERRSTGAQEPEVSSRPGVGPDQPAPLALPQNQLSTLHLPSPSVLQHFHTCKRQHHQLCETAPSRVPSFPVRLLGTQALWHLLQAPMPDAPCLPSQSPLRF